MQGDRVQPCTARPAPVPPRRRPLLLTTACLAAVSLPLGLLKLVALRHSQWPHRQWPPFVALYVAHVAFAVAHVLVAQVRPWLHPAGPRRLGWLGCRGLVLVAPQPCSCASRHPLSLPAPTPRKQRVVGWARNRWEHGLGGWGFPWQVRCLLRHRELTFASLHAGCHLCWCGGPPVLLPCPSVSPPAEVPCRAHRPGQEGEDAWLLVGQLQSQAEEGRRADGGGLPDADVPAEQLADPDSQWVECRGLRIHCKLALPLVSGGCEAGRRRGQHGRGWRWQLCLARERPDACTASPVRSA